MSLSLSFTNPILTRHLYSAAFFPPPPPPPPPSRSLFLSPHIPPNSRFHILYRVPQRATVLPANAATASIFQDTAATAAIFAGAYALIFGFDTLTQKELIQQSLSRKLVHILSGILFAISWPIFSNAGEARYFASLVPLVNSLRLVIHGLSLADDQSLLKSVTRQGNPKELLRGPLYYVVMLMFCAVVFWRESPVGLIALGMMCGGDGFADIMGRQFGSSKIPYNQSKSWVGSISMFVSGFFISIGSGSATSGVVGRNNLGLIMATCFVQHENVANAFMAEALACRQAILFARELGFSRVIIEGVSLTVIKKLNLDAVDRSLICSIVHDIKILSMDFNSISFCFVRRGANKTVHALAHECRNNPGPCYWVEEASVATTTECELDRSRLEQVQVP